MRGLGWALLTAGMVIVLVVLTTRPLAEPAPSAGSDRPSSESLTSAPANPPLPSAMPSSGIPDGTSAGTSAEVDDRLSITSVRPRRGPIAGGTDVIILGTGLDAVSAVRFGDRQADVLMQGHSRLVVRSPAGTSLDPVTIVLEHPQGAVEAAVFRYHR